MSLIRLNRLLFGIHQSRYYLVGADSGVGKTTFTNFVFVLEAIREVMVNPRPFHIHYYSFEIAEEELIAKWVVYAVKVLHEVDLHMDYILGRIAGLPMTDEHAALVEEGVDFVSGLLKYMTITDHVQNPTTIFNDMISYAETIGTVHRTVTQEVKKIPGKKPVTVTKSFITGYTANNDDELTLIVIDHVALSTPEQGKNTKDTIDLLSKYCVMLRNRFKFSPVLIQQFNTELQSVERRKFRAAALAPQRMDFGDSKYTYRDADIVFGLLNPSFFDIEEFYGYSILPSETSAARYHLGEFFIMAFIMKNRYGQTNLQIPMFMNGMTGVFYDLPNPDSEFELEEWGDQTINLRDICQSFCPPSQ